MRLQAKTILKNKQLIATSCEWKFLYKHFKMNLGYAKVNLETKTCTCHKYFDKGVCKHLIAACLHKNVSLPGLVQLSKKFKIVRRRRMRQYLEVSDVDSAGVEISEQVQVEQESHPYEEEALNVAIQPMKTKRGRKPKSTVVGISSTLGRPPLARNALEGDSGPILRRSNRRKNK